MGVMGAGTVGRVGRRNQTRGMSPRDEKRARQAMVGETERIRRGEAMYEKSVTSRLMADRMMQSRMFPDRWSAVRGQLITSMPENVRNLNDNYETNSVDGRVLDSHDTDDYGRDDRRAVSRRAMKDNAVDSRVLASSADNDAQRAVGANAMKDGSVTGRIIRDGVLRRNHFDYPNNLDSGRERPIIAEMIADSQVGVRILNMQALINELDKTYARRNHSHN